MAPPRHRLTGVSRKLQRTFRGETGDALEGSLRVPAIIKWPGKIAPRVSNEMVSIHDFAPTLASLIGAKMPADRPIDGVDQSASSSASRRSRAARLGLLASGKRSWRCGGAASASTRSRSWPRPATRRCQAFLATASKARAIRPSTTSRRTARGGQHRRLERLGDWPVSAGGRRVHEVTREVSEPESRQHDEIRSAGSNEENAYAP